MLPADRLKDFVRRVAGEAAVALLFAASTVAMLWPLPIALRTHTVDVGVDDPLLIARILGHYLEWIQGRRGFFDIAFFHPTPWALTTTDASLGVLYVAAPFLPFTRDLLALVNLGILLSFALSAHATYLLVRDLTGSRGAGIVAGSAFAFCLYRFHQLDHSNVLQMQWLVYALWALFRLRRDPRWTNGLLLTIFLFLQGSASMNVAAYGAVLLAAAAAWALMTVPRASRRRFVAVSLAAAALALPALVPIYRPYVLSSSIFETRRAVEEVRFYSGTVEQLRAAPPYNKLYGPSRSSSLGRESLTFLGWAVIALAAAGLVLGAVPAGRGLGEWRMVAVSSPILAAVAGAAALGLWHREVALALVLALFVVSAAAPR
ncbi:MAG TPA: hypothetical protein VE549_06550, partial [Myxococcaceae bacterium]|nr:hypothetical protein [Myxococcaceae bacterium]